jgi:integrase
LGEIEADREAPTVMDLIERFRAEHLPRKRPSTCAAYDHILQLHVEPHFGQHAKVADVTFADIDALHRKITKRGAPYVANRTIAVLGKMFSLAIHWGWRETNPTKNIERNLEHHRRRYLTGDELARLTKALAEHPEQQTADIVRVLLMTGARRGEVLAMRWADVDLAAGTWSKLPSSTKQKEHHQVPLSAPVRQLLSEIWNAQGRQRGEFVFPGAGVRGHVVAIKKGWASLCKAAGIKELRIHDLRHSFASQLASGGASLPLIGSMLGHADPATTARYSHLFQDPMRAAAEKVGAVIAAAGKPTKPVVKLKRKGVS